VLILSERPNRPLVWMAPFFLRSSITIQTVVAPRSYSNPPRRDDQAVGCRKK
jgi:hypothetical protein